MSKCFVIQPFQSKEYEKRYRDILKPAIESAGFEAYRVDKDDSTTVLIDAIEAGIERASVCLADISEDNPNVWFELGYARAARRPIVMICSNARRTHLPFDIRHRTVIFYDSDSTSDFESLKSEIHKRLISVVNQSLEQLKSDRIEDIPSLPQRSLDRNEFTLLTVLSEESGQAGTGGITHWLLEKRARKVGLSSIDIGVAYRELIDDGVIETGEEVDYNSGESYTVVRITGFGWKCIKEDQYLFVLSEGTLGNKQTKSSPPVQEKLDNDVPF